MVRPKSLVQIAVCSISVLYFISCSKSDSDGGGGGNNPPVDKCAGKTITIGTTLTAPSGCGGTGGITVNASGGNNFMYKLNSGGAYQASNVFNNLAAGTYTVFVKDGDGCEKTASVSLDASVQVGPLFSAVKSLMSQKCQPCHNNSIQNGGMNWEVDCNIVANKARIKARAVDEGTMPPTGPLSTSEKKTITDWITAGGLASN